MPVYWRVCLAFVLLAAFAPLMAAPIGASADEQAALQRLRQNAPGPLWIRAGHLTPQARQLLEPGVAQTIALLSLRLGEATSSSAWLDFVVRLYSGTATVVPLTVVNAMQALARKLGGVDRSALRQYAAILEERAGALTIEERCVLDRLAALATSSFSYGPSRAAG